MQPIQQTDTLTAADLIRQGYTAEHARDVAAREAMKANRQQAAAELAESVTRTVSAQASARATRAARTIPPPPVTEPPTSAQVREWAAQEGIKCSPVGRLPVALLAQYAQAHP